MMVGLYDDFAKCSYCGNVSPAAHKMIREETPVKEEKQVKGAALYYFIGGALIIMLGLFGLYLNVTHNSESSSAAQNSNYSYTSYQEPAE